MASNGPLRPGWDAPSLRTSCDCSAPEPAAAAAAAAAACGDLTVVEDSDASCGGDTHSTLVCGGSEKGRPSLVAAAAGRGADAPRTGLVLDMGGPALGPTLLLRGPAGPAVRWRAPTGRGLPRGAALRRLGATCDSKEPRREAWVRPEVIQGDVRCNVNLPEKSKYDI